jgi:hypothetical protein
MKLLLIILIVLTKITVSQDGYNPDRIPEKYAFNTHPFNISLHPEKVVIKIHQHELMDKKYYFTFFSPKIQSPDHVPPPAPASSNVLDCYPSINPTGYNDQDRNKLCRNHRYEQTPPYMCPDTGTFLNKECVNMTLTFSWSDILNNPDVKSKKEGNARIFALNLQIGYLRHKFPGEHGRQQWYGRNFMHTIFISYIEDGNETANGTLIRAACQFETLPKCLAQGLCTFQYPKTDYMANLHTIPSDTGDQILVYTYTHLEDGEGAFRGFLQGWPHSPPVEKDQTGTFLNRFDYWRCPVGKPCKRLNFKVILGYGFSCAYSEIDIKPDVRLILSYRNTHYDWLNSPYVAFGTKPVYVGLFTSFLDNIFKFSPDPTLRIKYFDFRTSEWEELSIPNDNIEDAECNDPNYADNLKKCWKLNNKNQFFSNRKGYLLKIDATWRVAPRSNKKSINGLNNLFELKSYEGEFSASATTPFQEEEKTPITLIVSMTILAAFLVSSVFAIFILSAIFILRKYYSYKNFTEEKKNLFEIK